VVGRRLLGGVRHVELYVLDEVRPDADLRADVKELRDDAVAEAGVELEQVQRREEPPLALVGDPGLATGRKVIFLYAALPFFGSPY
jgi:hypothetical protein